MESIREIYKVGRGPSSSHTMGPMKAAEMFRELCPGASSFVVTLYGSLAATGKGHLTDVALKEVLDPENTGKLELVWKSEVFLPQHPNGMKFEAKDETGTTILEKTYFSIGGGDVNESGKREKAKSIYPHSKMKDILGWCNEHNSYFWEYVEMYEGKEIWDFLADRWEVMKKSIAAGLDHEGVLQGGLNVRRKAYSYYQHACSYQNTMQRRGMLFAYALAVSEENAAGGTIVTAPTCGSCGVLPAVLYLIHTCYNVPEKKIINAMGAAGLIGTIIKANASISGAEVGCQGEIGTACAMASAAATRLFGGTPPQIECAASMGMEHFLGLTCDPICGLVQIPCIERNAFAAARVMDVTQYSLMSDGSHIVPFDTVIEAMKQTGHDLPSLYKETSKGGLANLIKNK